MSRIGNRVLEIPANVEVKVENNIVSVKGPKGELSAEINKNINVEVKDNTVVITRSSDEFKNFHGTTNANIKNMIKGVTEGFEKKLEAAGVGYRFAVKGNEIVVSAGYSHPVNVKVPAGITVESPSNTELFIKGANKQLVGEFAANVRKIREPEPYKGKGIRYANETIIRKVGKKAS